MMGDGRVGFVATSDELTRRVLTIVRCRNTAWGVEEIAGEYWGRHAESIERNTLWLILAKLMVAGHLQEREIAGVAFFAAVPIEAVRR